MATNEQELGEERLTDKEINRILGYEPRPAPQAGSMEIVSAIFMCDAQVAKLKARGWKSLEEVAEFGLSVNEAAFGVAKAAMIAEGYVKWDREKVAELCFNCNYLTSSTSWSEAKKAETERAYEQADQLHRILTGGE